MQWTKEAFCNQVLAAEASLYRVAISILHNNEDCADAIQEGIFKAYQNRNTLKNAQYFKTWLTKIVINECRLLLRRRKHEAVLDAYPLQAAAGDEPEEGEALAKLHEMDEKYRLPIVLNVIEGYTSKEISEMLDLPHATIRTRLARGKAILKKQLEGEG